MHLTNFSWNPTEPCLLLKWSNVTVLVDCNLDFSPLYSYLPHVFSRSSELKKMFNNVSNPNVPDMQFLKQIKENIYVESVPEVYPTPLESLQMENVDCILISNWNSFVALPFYAHNSGFRGSIYATNPVLQFGGLMMQEIVDYFEQITYEDCGLRWKHHGIYSQFPNSPTRNPREWKKFYSRDVMKEVLANVNTVSYRQPVEIEGKMVITAFSSGYHIGSCNWILQTNNDTKFTYMASTSTRATHTSSVDWENISGSDAMICTSLNNSPECDPQNIMATIQDVVTSTLKRGGNVLMPVSPVGSVYTLIEIISGFIDVATTLSVSTPIYFVSPVAKTSLAYASVNGEWLSEMKQKAMYTPEEPFIHQQLMRSGRLKVYENLYDSFSKEFKSPCVMLCGHPSLRIGDAAHMLQMWGEDSRNSVIFTSSDFLIDDVYGPFMHLNIRAYGCPIDTRLNFPQLNATIIPDLKAKVIYVPEAYVSPPLRNPTRVDLRITKQCTPLMYDSPVLVHFRKAKKRKITLHPDLTLKLEAKGHPSAIDFGVCNLSGSLSVFDNAYELQPVKKRQGAFRQRYSGRLEIEQIKRALIKRKIPFVVENQEVVIKSLCASIKLANDGLKTVIKAPPEHRAQLMDVITSYLSVFG